MSTGEATVPRNRAAIVEQAGSWARRNVWTIGLLAVWATALTLYGTGVSAIAEGTQKNASIRVRHRCTG